MKYSVAAVVASTLISSSTAITLGQRTPAPRVIGLDLERSNSVSNPSHDRNRLRRRAGVVSETLDNEETLYYANVTLGTPAQSLRLHIDTGSSDLWVNTPNSTLCETEQGGGCQGGTYDPSSSSSYQYVNSDFNISYVDGTGSSGDYGTDTLTIGGHTLTDFQFGLGFTSSSQEGVLGIGYTLNEVQVNRAGLDAYPNLPKAMVDAGLINSNAYSLWLNDLDASTGTILFGGVNSGKYTGDLATVPILKEYDNYYEFTIALSGMSIAGSTISSSDFSLSVLLDSGTTLIYLPDGITTVIFDQVNAVYDSSVGYAYVECSLQDNSSTIDFVFSGQSISVSFDELVLSEQYSSDGQPLTFSNGAAACAFGIAPTTDSQSVLGDTFLRSAYVVYDLANNEISLAQTDFNSTTNDVREITTGTDSVPGAVAVASAVTTVAASTGGATVNGQTSTVSSTTTSLSSAGTMLDIQIMGVVLAAVAAVFITL